MEIDEGASTGRVNVTLGFGRAEYERLQAWAERRHLRLATAIRQLVKASVEDDERERAENAKTARALGG